MYTNPLSGIVEGLQEKASVRTAFGDPVVTAEKTTIPVARVAYGFGGGYGSDAGRESVGDESFFDEAATGDAGEGGGLGGGISVKPLGVVEVTADDTRFVPFEDRRRTLVTALLAFAVGVLVGRRRGRSGA